MMDSEDLHITRDESKIPSVVNKCKSLSNGSNEQETTDQIAKSKLLVQNIIENGLTCNGKMECDFHTSDLSEGTGLCDTQKNSFVGDVDSAMHENKKSAGASVSKLLPNTKDKDGQIISRLEQNCDDTPKGKSDVSQTNCDRKENTTGALDNSRSALGSNDENKKCNVDRNSEDTDHIDEMDTESICVISNVTSGVLNDVNFDSPCENRDDHMSDNEQGTENVKKRKSQSSDKGNGQSVDNEGKDVKIVNDESTGKNVQTNTEAVKNGKGAEETSETSQSNLSKNKRSENENMKNDISDCQILNTDSPGPNKRSNNHADTTVDDIEIIGESKVVLNSNTPKNVPKTSQKMPNTSTTNSNIVAAPSLQNAAMGQGLKGMPAVPSRFPFQGGVPGQGSSNLPLYVPTVAPPKPKSSLDQIELIRWEIQNRINTRPKYFKPNSASELGPLAKFLFDIGSDLIKECVYHDLVKIQSKKKGDDKLSTKEKEDLEKLKEIEKELHATIGHLKFKLKQKCKTCHFQTESRNVMLYHKQFPHEDNKFLKCAYCSFATRQTMAFKFHMEAEHGQQARLNDKKAFYECDLCPYENNQEQKLVLHKQRCLKQFRPLFNLHPSCLSGAEINLCLENIFYRPVIPKNLKLLQQKHAAQQAALAEAKKQQAQIQAMAAQKNAAAVAAKKQQQAQKRLPTPTLPAAVSSSPASNVSPAPRMPYTPRTPARQQPVRYNAAANAKTPPTIATTLNTKQIAPPTPGASGNTAAGGFEVCEICGGYVKDRKALRIHFFYAHRIDLPFNLFERNQAPLYCATCYVRFWTAHGLRKHIDTHKEENQTRGVVGKCISCGHHVLNLLLHMRVVHNREMQHYINALMCMFCGGHFSSHQECERHIVKVHGNVDPVTGTLKTAPNTPSPQQPTPKTSQNNKKPANNNLVKGSVCVLCNLNFGRNVDLTRHCMRMHHTCMKCGMVVIDKASLMKHTCLTSPSGTRDCTMCGEAGFHPAYYVKHLRDKHLKRFSIRVSKLSKSTIEQWMKRPYPFEESEILVEISDSDEDAPKKETKVQTSIPPKKKPRIGPASKIGRGIASRDTEDKPVAEVQHINKKEEKQASEIDHEEKAVKDDAADSDREDKVNAEGPVVAEDDSTSCESSASGHKRKLEESPDSDQECKRIKSS